MNRRQSHVAQMTFVYVFLFFVLAAWSLPPAWMILTSLKDPGITFSIPPVWLFIPTPENFATVISRPFFFQYLTNSIVISTVTSVIEVLLGAMAAYSLSRY